MSNSSTQYEDVFIDTESGLDQILDSVNDIHFAAYDAFTEKLTSSQAPELVGHGDMLDTLYGELIDLLNEGKQTIAGNASLPESQITKLQAKYDKLCKVRDHILSFVPTRKTLSTSSAAPKLEIEQSETKPMEKSTPKKDAAGLTEETVLAAITEVVKEANDIKPISAALRDQLKELRSEDKEAADELFKQLRSTYRRLEGVLKKLHDLKKIHKAPAVKQTSLEKYQLALKEIRNNLDEIKVATQVLDSSDAQEKSISSERKSKAMQIANDDTDGAVTISVAGKSVNPEQTEMKPIHNSLLKEKQPTPVIQQSTSPPSAIQSALPDPVDQAVSFTPKRVMVPPEPILESTSLTARYLNAPEYMSFITERYSSPEAFERILDSTITRIEGSTLDPIERWLGESPASSFVFLQNMTLEEVNEFANQPFKKIKIALQKENIKYEAFVLWLDLMDGMQSLVEPEEGMTFGELFAKWMIAQDMISQ